MGSNTRGQLRKDTSLRGKVPSAEGEHLWVIRLHAKRKLYDEIPMSFRMFMALTYHQKFAVVQKKL